VIITNLKGITHNHVESCGIRRDGYPQTIMQANLEARNIVGSQDGQDLRVGVLTKTNSYRWRVPICDLFDCRIVIKSKNWIAMDVSDEPTEYMFIRDPQALSRKIKNLTCKLPNCSCVITHRTTAEMVSPLSIREEKGRKERHTNILPKKHKRKKRRSNIKIDNWQI